jgi:hypothetical protein
MDEQRIDSTISYDVVTLPTNGIFYENKKKSVRVAYLTTPDEDILLSKNLLATNRIIPEILRRKILDKDIDVDLLEEDDKHAILVFLRNTAYGTDYKIKAYDPKEEKEFSYDFDLSILKTKDFKLTADANGEYPYKFQKVNADITFKFLTKKEEDQIDELEKNWNGIGEPPIVTKRMQMMIKSLNGNRDLMSIKHFIDSLPIKEGQDFRKYVADNKPGLDLKQTIKTPSGETIQVELGFGVEFFRPFYGL